MREARIEIKSVAERDDFQRWEDHMLEKAQCWNQYCDGLYGENEVRAVHVVKEENPNFTFLQLYVKTVSNIPEVMVFL